MTQVDVRLLGPSDEHVLEHVAAGVFDLPLKARWTREFLADPRHHLVVAVEDGWVVGMVTAVHYVHPDKAPQLWINEVGVAPTHHGRGIARRMLAEMLAHGRTLDCTEAWVGTEHTNTPAQRLYAGAEGARAPEPFLMYTFENL